MGRDDWPSHTDSRSDKGLSSNTSYIVPPGTINLPDTIKIDKRSSGVLPTASKELLVKVAEDYTHLSATFRLFWKAGPSDDERLAFADELDRLLKEAKLVFGKDSHGRTGEQLSVIWYMRKRVRANNIVVEERARPPQVYPLGQNGEPDLSHLRGR